MVVTVCSANNVATETPERGLTGCILVQTKADSVESSMATEIEQQLNAELKDAMRSGDGVRRDAVRMLLSALKYEAIELQRPLEADDVEQVVLRIAKRHRDSIDQFKKGNRPDLVEHEEQQLAVVERFARQQMMSREEIEAVVRETMAELDVSGPRAMGPIMTALSQRLRGKADMRLVNEVVRSTLAASGAHSMICSPPYAGVSR
jgi:uncharacterized protein